MYVSDSLQLHGVGGDSGGGGCDPDLHRGRRMERGIVPHRLLGFTTCLDHLAC